MVTIRSDGGRHPPAASDADDGAGGGNAAFPWSDSSDEDEKSGAGAYPNYHMYSVVGFRDRAVEATSRNDTPQKSNERDGQA
jgi:hypothetical protein